MSTTRLSLESEIKEIREILASIPNENVIERIAFEERLATAEMALAKIPCKPFIGESTPNFQRASGCW